MCVCIIYFHNFAQHRVTVPLYLLHAERMHRIATGLFAALIDATSEKKPAYKATDCAAMFSQTPAKHALSIVVHTEPGLIH